MYIYLHRIIIITITAVYFLLGHQCWIPHARFQSARTGTTSLGANCGAKHDRQPFTSNKWGKIWTDECISIRFASHQNSQENSFPFGYIGSLCSQHFKQSWMDVAQDHASPNRQQEKQELQGFKIAVPNCNLILNTKSWTWLWDWFVPMNPWIMCRMGPASKPWVNNPRRYHVCFSFSTGSHQSLWNLKLVDPSLYKLFFRSEVFVQGTFNIFDQFDSRIVSWILLILTIHSTAHPEERAP